MTDENVTVAGRQARRTHIRADDKSQASMFLGIGSRYFFVVVASGDESLSLADPKVSAFFDNVTIQQ